MTPPLRPTDEIHMRAQAVDGAYLSDTEDHPLPRDTRTGGIDRAQLDEGKILRAENRQRQAVSGQARDRYLNRIATLRQAGNQDLTHASTQACHSYVMQILQPACQDMRDLEHGAAADDTLRLHDLQDVNQAADQALFALHEQRGRARYSLQRLLAPPAQRDEVLRHLDVQTPAVLQAARQACDVPQARNALAGAEHEIAYQFSRMLWQPARLDVELQQRSVRAVLDVLAEAPRLARLAEDVRHSPADATSNPPLARGEYHVYGAEPSVWPWEVRACVAQVPNARQVPTSAAGARIVAQMTQAATFAAHRELSTPEQTQEVLDKVLAGLRSIDTDLQAASAEVSLPMEDLTIIQETATEMTALLHDRRGALVAHRDGLAEASSARGMAERLGQVVADIAREERAFGTRFSQTDGTRGARDVPLQLRQHHAQVQVLVGRALRLCREVINTPALSRDPASLRACGETLGQIYATVLNYAQAALFIERLPVHTTTASGVATGGSVATQPVGAAQPPQAAAARPSAAYQQNMAHLQRLRQEQQAVIQANIRASMAQMRMSRFNGMF